MSVKTKAADLKATDRCDACGARAKAVATFINGPLLFCGHHAHQHYSGLLKDAISIEWSEEDDE